MRTSVLIAHERTTKQALIAVATALLCYLVIWFIPDDGEVYMIVGTTLLVVALVRGQRLSLFSRVFITVQVFLWGFGLCLAGRTMAAGLNRYTAGMALYFFSVYGLAPCFCLLRLWRFRLALTLICAVLPVSIALAELVAATEEHAFVAKYRNTGVGPTARRTVPHHWLSYDHEMQRLDGSD